MKAQEFNEDPYLYKLKKYHVLSQCKHSVHLSLHSGAGLEETKQSINYMWRKMHHHKAVLKTNWHNS